MLAENWKLYLQTLMTLFFGGSPVLVGNILTAVLRWRYRHGGEERDAAGKRREALRVLTLLMGLVDAAIIAFRVFLVLLLETRLGLKLLSIPAGALLELWLLALMSQSFSKKSLLILLGCTVPVFGAMICC